ncbi:MAG: peptidoglycan-binding domain-containing protein [Pseudomonadota bacterium]
MSVFRITAAAAAVILWAAPTSAADQTGNYATRGAGNTRCSDFTQARKDSAERYANYGGWIDGFLSGVNLFEDDTFDIAPWQSTNLLAAALGRYCGNNPTLAFHIAVSRLVMQLGDTRLLTNSKLQVHSGKGKQSEVQIAVYDAIIRRAQERLKGLGLLKGETNSDLSETMRKALVAFQKREKLEQSGLPDQATLLVLLAPMDGGNN